MTNEKFRYSLTILNSSVFVGLLIVIIYTIINWKTLSSFEGWGVAGMIILGIFILAGLIVDFILQYAFRNKIILNIVCVFFVLFYLYIIFIYF